MYEAIIQEKETSGHVWMQSENVIDKSMERNTFTYPIVFHPSLSSLKYIPDFYSKTFDCLYSSKINGNTFLYFLNLFCQIPQAFLVHTEAIGNFDIAQLCR